MSTLDQLAILDLSREIAALPRKRGAETIPVRTGPEQWITFHYSGVVYTNRTSAIERIRVLNEARHHLIKNWQTNPKKTPIYADRYMYDFVVLSDGTIVRSGDRHQFWHCGNVIGNATSWSVHVMLGGQQDLTQPQQISLFALFDALRIDSGLGRDRVISHCEWPRKTGLPRISIPYRRLQDQSECPGAILHRHIAAYRAIGAP